MLFFFFKFALLYLQILPKLEMFILKKQRLWILPFALSQILPRLGDVYFENATAVNFTVCIFNGSQNDGGFKWINSSFLFLFES